jgi:hypothetical protein
LPFRFASQPGFACVGISQGESAAETAADPCKAKGIKAGLPADVFVPMRKRTALGYLLDPLTQMLWLSGRQH